MRSSDFKDIVKDGLEINYKGEDTGLKCFFCEAKAELIEDDDDDYKVACRGEELHIMEMLDYLILHINMKDGLANKLLNGKIETIDNFEDYYQDFNNENVVCTTEELSIIEFSEDETDIYDLYTMEDIEEYQKFEENVFDLSMIESILNDMKIENDIYNSINFNTIKKENSEEIQINYILIFENINQDMKIENENYDLSMIQNSIEEEKNENDIYDLKKFEDLYQELNIEDDVY